jgi:hypothetical protein
MQAITRSPKKEMQAACNRISGEEIHQLHDEERQLRVSIDKFGRQVEEGRRQKVDDYERRMECSRAGGILMSDGHLYTLTESGWDRSK